MNGAKPKGAQFNKFAKSKMLRSILYILLIVLGIFFIINNSKILEISFYIIGGAAALYGLVTILSIFIDKTRSPLSVFNFISALFIMGAGASFLIYAKPFSTEYWSAFSTLIILNSIFRILGAYMRKRSGGKDWLPRLILGIFGFVAGFFLIFFRGPEIVPAILCGVIAIIEGLFGLFTLHQLDKVIIRLIKKEKSKPGQPIYKSNNDEIVITDYEIIEDNKNNDSKGSDDSDIPPS